MDDASAIDRLRLCVLLSSELAAGPRPVQHAGWKTEIDVNKDLKGNNLKAFPFRGACDAQGAEGHRVWTSCD